MHLRGNSLLATLLGAALLTTACGGIAPARTGQAPAATASSGNPAATPSAGAGTAPATGTATPSAPASGTATASASAATAASTPASPPATWAALGKFTPLSVQPNRGRIAPDPAAPGVLAVCVPGGVRISRDGGASWTRIGAAGVPAALKSTGYAIPVAAGQPVPACQSAVATAHAGGIVAAVYAVGPAKYGMPPVFYVALFTADGGRTWKPVPPPRGFAAGGFGGLSVAGSGALQALFGRPLGQGQDQQPPFALVATANGGAAWQAARLGCPAGGGPCLRWGPATSGTGSCAMHAYPQPVEVSTDGGRTWTPASGPARQGLANGCDLNELVGLSATRALLVGRDAAGGGASVRWSGDGGRTWRPVSLPPLPPGTSPAPGGVQMLPDGALIAVVSGQASPLPVDLLAPGADAWCTVPGLTIGGTYTDPGTLQPDGNRLIWLQQDRSGGSPALKSTPLSAVRC